MFFILCSSTTSLTSVIILPSFSSTCGRSLVIVMLGDRYSLHGPMNQPPPPHPGKVFRWCVCTCMHILVAMLNCFEFLPFQIAKEEEKGVYLTFLNFLINDSIYLLDESLNKILELKELEAEMSNTTEWEQRPAQERQERTRLFHSQENVSLTFSFLIIYTCVCVCVCAHAFNGLCF